MRALPVILVLLGSALALGCSSATAPDQVKVVGVIDGLAAGAPQVEVPTTVQAGQAFTVTVTTSGLNGCWELHDTEVDVDGATAVVTPYDLEYRGNEYGCTSMTLTFQHTASVTFATPGGARVEIRGREVPGGPIVTVVRTVVVE